MSHVNLFHGFSLIVPLHIVMYQNLVGVPFSIDRNFAGQTNHIVLKESFETKTDVFSARHWICKPGIINLTICSQHDYNYDLIYEIFNSW